MAQGNKKATQQTMPLPRSGAGPPKYEHPQTIDATPDEIAEVVLRGKPQTVWRYEQESQHKRGK